MDIETLPSEAPAAAPEPSSFADHEAQFSNRPKLVEARQPAETSPADNEVLPPAPERGDSKAGEPDRSHTNRVKDGPKRAQTATPDDLPTISALTKEYKTALEEAGFAVERKEGESERVYAVRQRAELAKALVALKKAPAAPPPQAPEPPRYQTAAQNGDGFGEFNLPENFPQRPDAKNYTDYTEYLIADTRWNARAEYMTMERNREQAQQAQAFATNVQSRFTEAKARYTDFDAVVLNPHVNSPIPRGSIIEQFTFKHATGPDVAYHLFKHPDEVAKFQAISDDYVQVAELALLGQRLTQKTQAPVGTTRSTTPAIATPIVKPPNLVRTGAVASGDEPPGDGASFAEHEKYFGTSRRRR